MDRQVSRAGLLPSKVATHRLPQGILSCPCIVATGVTGTHWPDTHRRSGFHGAFGYWHLPNAARLRPTNPPAYTIIGSYWIGAGVG